MIYFYSHAAFNGMLCGLCKTSLGSTAALILCSRGRLLVQYCSGASFSRVSTYPAYEGNDTFGCPEVIMLCKPSTKSYVVLVTVPLVIASKIPQYSASRCGYAVASLRHVVYSAAFELELHEP